MALTLIATVGGTTSNSYCTKAEADAYHESRLHNTTWTSATTTQHEAALVWATRLMDEQITWKGTPVSENQALAWPQEYQYDRYGNDIDEDVIPNDVKNAVAEFAFFLIASDRTADSDSKGIKRMKVDVVEFEFDKMDAPQIMPRSVWSMIQQYGIKTQKTNRTLSRG